MGGEVVSSPLSPDTDLMISIANPAYGEGPALYKLAEHGAMQSKLARNTWFGPEDCQTRPWPEVCVLPLSMPSSSHGKYSEC